MKLFGGNSSDNENRKPDVSEENPGARTPRVPEDRTYYEDEDGGAPRGSLSRGMKIYLGIAIPLLAIVICALLYVLFFVKPPAGESGVSTVPTGSAATTTSATTSAPATSATSASTEATTTTTTEATTAALSEEELVEAAIMELSEEAVELSAPEKGVGDNPRREGVLRCCSWGLTTPASAPTRS